MGMVRIAATTSPGSGVRGLDAPARRRLFAMASVVCALHASGFGLLVLAASDHARLATTSFGFGTGMLAYSLGLRHAFDADHITAIDNTTRAMMAQGKRPLATGFFFALGHSTVVFVMSIVLCLGVRAVYAQVRDDSSSLHHWTNLVGTAVSGGFLLLIGVVNVVVLANVLRMFRSIRGGGDLDDDELERHLAGRGLLSRLLGGLTRRVDATWKMYPLGILFGLGFDTATEISLLVLAGSTVNTGLPFWAILSLPLLFAAGMSLLDTIDGAFMNFAYGWAFSRPVRKVYYNLTITGLSVAVALFVGGLEIAQVMAGQFHLDGGFWAFAAAVDLNRAGFIIVGTFVVVWAGAIGIWRFGRIEQRWEAQRPAP